MDHEVSVVLVLLTLHSHLTMLLYLIMLTMRSHLTRYNAFSLMHVLTMTLHHVLIML